MIFSLLTGVILNDIIKYRFFEEEKLHNKNIMEGIYWILQQF